MVLKWHTTTAVLRSLFFSDFCGFCLNLGSLFFLPVLLISSKMWMLSTCSRCCSLLHFLTQAFGVVPVFSLFFWGGLLLLWFLADSPESKRPCLGAMTPIELPKKQTSLSWCCDSQQNRRRPCFYAAIMIELPTNDLVLMLWFLAAGSPSKAKRISFLTCSRKRLKASMYDSNITNPNPTPLTLPP